MEKLVLKNQSLFWAKVVYFHEHEDVQKES